MSSSRSNVFHCAACIALLSGLVQSAYGQTEAPASVDTDELASFGPKGADPDEEFGAAARRHELDAQPEPTGEPAADEEEVGDRVSLKIGVDWTTGYYFRGLRQEDRGFILQPYAEIGFEVVSTDDVTLTILGGLWNSFHDRQTGADPASNDFTDTWYEADLYGGAAITIGSFGFSTIYTTYTSPSDAWETIDELIFSLSYDDSAHWGESSFRLSPSLTLGLEVGADYADGADTERGIYLQPGLSPGFTADLPVLEEVEFTFPIVVGLSLDNYYEDATGEDNAFGYVSVGGKMSFALPVPKSFGEWRLSGGAYALFLGDTTEEFNGGDDTEIIGSVGISVEF